MIFRDHLLSIVGQVTWKPVRTHGSMFFLDFGRPIREARHRRDHGEFCFLIEFADWLFYRNGEPLVTMDDNVKTIDDMFENMDLGLVSNVSTVSEADTLDIAFDNNITFNACQSSYPRCQNGTQWIFYNVLGSWAYEEGEISFEAK